VLQVDLLKAYEPDLLIKLMVALLTAFLIGAENSLPYVVRVLI